MNTYMWVCVRVEEVCRRYGCVDVCEQKKKRKAALRGKNFPEAFFLVLCHSPTTLG